MCPKEPMRSPLVKPSVPGSTPGSGISSSPSPSGPRSPALTTTTSPPDVAHAAPAGPEPALIQAVHSLSAGTGLRRFLTVLATSSLSKGVEEDERMLTFSWGLERAVLTSIIENFDGVGDEIQCELSIPLEALGTTSASTSRRTQTSGRSGVNFDCDGCGEPRAKGEPYVMVVRPPHGLSLYHETCFPDVVNPLF